VRLVRSSRAGYGLIVGQRALRRFVLWPSGVLVLTAFGVVTSSYAVASPSLTLSTTSVPPGGSFTASGAGFAAGEPVNVSIGTAALTSTTASPTGTFKVVETVPRSTPTAGYTVVATGQRSGRSAKAAIVVRVNWPQFGFGIAHTNADPLENVVSPSNVSALTSKWSAAGTGDIGHSSPVDADGMVFQTCNFSMCAYKQGSGARVWKTVKRTVDGVAAVAANIVVTTEPTCGVTGRQCQYLRAFSESTGAPIWVRTIPPSDDFTPLIAGTTLYVSTRKALYALRLSTGATIWSKSGTFTTAPAAAAGIIVLGTGNGVEAYNASTGSVLWNVSSPTWVGYPPLIAQGLVITSGTAPAITGVSAFDLASGTMSWSADYAVDGPLAYDGTSLFVPTNGGGLVSAVPATGVLQWWTPSVPVVTASPAVANGVVYFGTDTTITAASASTGAILWTSPTLTAQTVGTVIETNGRLYAATHDGALHAWGL
jgi:hypothetical protein